MSERIKSRKKLLDGALAPTIEDVIKNRKWKGWKVIYE